MASCSNVQNCSDEWETLRLDSTDGGLLFRTLMIRPLCVCVLCGGIYNSIWVGGVVSTVSVTGSNGMLR